MDEEWKGGDVRLYSGGGHKVNLLKAAMQKYYEKENLIIMFVDRYVNYNFYLLIDYFSLTRCSCN